MWKNIITVKLRTYFFIVNLFIYSATCFLLPTEIVPLLKFDPVHSNEFSKQESLAVLQNNENYLLIGGKNVVYRVNAESLGVEDRIEWKPSADATQECLNIVTDESQCENYIRIAYDSSEGQVFCGTYALHPTCAVFKEKKIIRTFSGIGIVPYEKVDNVPFYKVNDSLFTATVTEYSSSDSLFLRQNIRKPSNFLRTSKEHFENAKFIEILPNQEEILLFFTESPFESESCYTRRVSRVGRVCKDDMGAKKPYDKEWSSFVKARLECKWEEPDSEPMYFNQLTSVFATSTHIYASFVSQLAGIGASAVCVYARSQIISTFNEAFQEKSSCSRASNPNELTNLRNQPLIEKKISANPLFVHHGEDKFMKIVVESHARDLNGRSNTMIYIATDKGRILKAVRDFNFNENASAKRVAIYENDIVKNSQAVSLSLHTEWLPNGIVTSTLLFITANALLRFPTSTCTILSPTSSSTPCNDCLKHKDPHCAWLETTSQCVEVSENWSRRRYLTQNSSRCHSPSPLHSEPLLHDLGAAARPHASLNAMIDCPACHCPTTEAPSHPLDVEVVHHKDIARAMPIWGRIFSIESLFLFSLGLTTGALVNYLLSYRNVCRTKHSSKDSQSSAILAYASPNNSISTSHPLTVSMTSSRQTYC